MSGSKFVAVVLVGSEVKVQTAVNSAVSLHGSKGWRASHTAMTGREEEEEGGGRRSHMTGMEEWGRRRREQRVNWTRGVALARQEASRPAVGRHHRASKVLPAKERDRRNRSYQSNYFQTATRRQGQRTLAADLVT